MKQIITVCFLLLIAQSAVAGQADRELGLTGHCPRCDLSHKKLDAAKLRGANLSRAVLKHAKLKGADLSSSNLMGADLRNADLSNANLTQADLFGANLKDAKIKNANFTGARLAGAIWVDGSPCSTTAPLGQCH